MIQEPLGLRTCRVCGVTLADDSNQANDICGDCAIANPDRTGSVVGEPAVVGDAGQPTGALLAGENRPYDPDHPTWGPLAGIFVWIASVAAIIIVPLVAVAAWYIISKLWGVPVPALQAQSEVFEWLKSPPLLLLQVGSTSVAHLITLVICWPIVTKMGTRPFWASLGWHWGGRSPLFWVLFSVVVIAALVAFSQVAVRFLPENENTPFAELLRSSAKVRIALALLATFSAPIVEEVIYRGILFSALRSRIGVGFAVVCVTTVFAGVHVVQNSGAWVTISGLVFLSLILTLVRARTRSILPCVVIHFVNNAFFSMLIVANKG